jgi:hypothetical protein
MQIGLGYIAQIAVLLAFKGEEFRACGAGFG